VSTDLIEAFVTEGRRLYGERFPQIEFLVSDANDLRFDDASFELVFANWLLMYLDDAQLDAFVERVRRWLTPSPDARFFFRESCEASISGARKKADSPVHYRSVADYEQVLARHGFELDRSGNVKLYVKHYGNPNQRWFCWRLKQ